MLSTAPPKVPKQRRVAVCIRAGVSANYTSVFRATIVLLSGPMAALSTVVSVSTDEVQHVFKHCNVDRWIYSGWGQEKACKHNDMHVA